MKEREFFPDGTPVDEWFYRTEIPRPEMLGMRYVITEHGVSDDGRIYTEEIQSLIDTAAENGGGVIVVPEGTYLTGALFFKQGVHLCVEKGGVLKGSDDISDYPVRMTRIEGETCRYFTALINAEDVDGFTLCGEGMIDGNGLRSWKAFWLRREWNPDCTNKDEQRPRLIYIANSKNVTIAGLRLCNSHFWTTHIYKCSRVRYLGCDIYSPASPVPAPSTDAIDIDACTDVLIKNCRFEVNDDAVVLKGGKGPWADTMPENGPNERIIIEDCDYGFCHGCLTCGSECVHAKNVIMRRIRVNGAYNLLWLKARPDTPQRYEHISVEDVTGRAGSFLNVYRWTQFYDLKGREDTPLTYIDGITMSRCKAECMRFIDAEPDPERVALSNIALKELDIKVKDCDSVRLTLPGISAENVDVETI